MLPDWLTEEIDAVPGHDRFAGVDELHARLRALAAAHPDAAKLETAGTSRQGEPLLCLAIEDAGPPRPTALVFGLPHPNEPIGGLTALHLAERLCTDPALRARLGHDWRIIACIDPDGLRLNEGWLAGPFTRAHYARHFYRPAASDQVEWTFPLDYKDAHFDAALPETRALMRLIDTHRPSLVCSLHNGERGGVYYYLSRAEPALHTALQRLPERLGLPLHRGEPEVPYLVPLAEGIFLGSSIRDGYDYRAGLGEPWVGGSGDNTVSYANRYGALTLVSELPYWATPASGDSSPSGTNYAGALAQQALELAELGELLDRTLASVAGLLLAPDSPYWRATRFFATYLASTASCTRSRSELRSSAREATVAEAATLRADVHSFRLRYAGILLRALDGELAVGNTHVAVRAARAAVAHRYEGWLAEDAGDGDYTTIPIRLLVANQYGAILAAASHLAGGPQ